MSDVEGQEYTDAGVNPEWAATINVRIDTPYGRTLRNKADVLQELNALQAQADLAAGLRAALEQRAYIDHASHCGLNYQRKRCSCGFEEWEAKLNALLNPQPQSHHEETK